MTAKVQATIMFRRSERLGWHKGRECGGEIWRLDTEPFMVCTVCDGRPPPPYDDETDSDGGST